MTDAARILDWTLPAAGPIRAAPGEGFVELAPGLHAETRLLHRRSLRTTHGSDGKPVESEMTLKFSGPRAWIADSSGVPLLPGLRLPEKDLREMLTQTADALNAAVAALADPNAGHPVDVLFPPTAPRMTLGRVKARSRLGRALTGWRFERDQNRALLRGFLRQYPGEDSHNREPEASAADPWVDRLHAALSGVPRLAAIDLSLMIDPDARQLSARFQAAAADLGPLPSFLARLDPPGLTLGPNRFGTPAETQRRLAQCEVDRLLHLALRLYPWPDWTLSASFQRLNAEGVETAVHSARITGDTSMVETLSP